MLQPQEIAEIEHELSTVPTRRAACVEGLRSVQRHRGWVSDEALRELAEHLEMSPSELEGVATFYNLIYRRPVGRHVILLCDSVSCWVMGCDRLRARLRERLGIDPGETTPDRRFTLLPMACLGACERAAALMVDEDLHGDVDAERLDAILEDYA